MTSNWYARHEGERSVKLSDEAELRQMEAMSLAASAAEEEKEIQLEEDNNQPGTQ